MLVITSSPPITAPPPQGVNDPRFLDPLELEYIDGKNYRVTQAFDYHTDVYPLVAVQVPKNFLTDFASVPRLMWNILPPTGMYGKAAVIHDYLYRTKGVATRAEADAVFLEAMTALGVTRATRETMYWAVRMFGRSSYKGGM